MDINFANINNILKQPVKSCLLASVFLHSCINMESKYNMEVTSSAYFDENDSNLKPKSLLDKKNRTSKYVLIGVGGLCLGAAIATAIEVPVYNGYLSDQKNQLSDSLSYAKLQATLLTNAIIPILAENENAIYGLANGTSIYGNSSSISNLGPNEILSINSVDLTSTASTLYTAEQEFNFLSLTQILPSLNDLTNITLINQFIAEPVNLVSTSLNSITLSGSCLNATVTLPNKLSNAILSSTVRCLGGEIICQNGNTTNPNCLNPSVNSSFANYNQQDVLSTLCNNYTDYQQLLTNYTTLNNAYGTLQAYQSIGGSQICSNCINQLGTLNNTYLLLQSNYLNLTNVYNECTSTLNTAISSCNTCNSSLGSMTSLYYICSNYGQYENAANLYITCNTQLNNLTSLYNTCSLNGYYPNAYASYMTCSNNGANPNCFANLQPTFNNYNNICNAPIIYGTGQPGVGGFSGTVNNVVGNNFNCYYYSSFAN